MKKEAKDQKDFGMTKNKASGSLWYKPGDASNGEWLCESKQTDKKSYSITLKNWDKLFEEALFSKKLPLLSIQIKDVEIVVLDKIDFINLLKRIR